MKKKFARSIMFDQTDPAVKAKLLPVLIGIFLSCYAITCYAQSVSTENNIDKVILSSYYKKDEKMKHVNMDALRDFIKRFPLATGVKWESVKGDNIATFLTGNKETMAAYKKNGKWAYTISRYNDEKMLPAEVRALVKRTYYDYAISHIDAIEACQHESIIYLVQVQDDKNFKTIRVCDGEFEVIHELVKDN